MARSSKPKPTQAEMAILQVLWEQGPCTVRQIQEELTAQRGTGYTTTLKLMQIMHEKGHLRRNESEHAHIYSAAVTRTRTQRQMVKQLLDQVFGGSSQQLVLQALATKKSTPAELAEIRRLLDKLEGDSE